MVRSLRRQGRNFHERVPIDRKTNLFFEAKEFESYIYIGIYSLIQTTIACHMSIKLKTAIHFSAYPVLLRSEYLNLQCVFRMR